MKLFMRNHYQKSPMSYDVICLKCAINLGGKMESIATWHINHCDCCGLETNVTQPINFSWRTE